MIYEVKYDPKTEKQLEKLSKDIAGRIIKKVREVVDFHEKSRNNWRSWTRNNF